MIENIATAPALEIENVELSNMALLLVVLLLLLLVLILVKELPRAIRGR